MAHLFRPMTTKPIPRKASIVTHNGARCAKWVARGGRTVLAPLTPDGTRCRVKSPTWWVQYTQADGTRGKVPGFRDRAATLQLAAELGRTAEAIRAGKEAPAPHLGTDHLADFVPLYRDHLAQKGNMGRGVNEIAAALTRTIREAGLTTPAAVDCEKLAGWLHREAKARDWSARTLATRITRLKSFGNWLVPKRARFNPFAPLTKPNAEADRRRIRRALDADELTRLVRATRLSGEDFEGMAATDRAALYLTAGYTGRRANALAGLTPESFLIEGGVVTAIVTKAGRNKNRREHVVPIQVDAGRELAKWLKTKAPGKPVFVGRTDWHRRAASMLRSDLIRVGIPYRDAAGDYLDFHSLRATYCTMLATSGVILPAAMALMGVSNSELVTRVYAKVKPLLAGEVAKMPKPGKGLLG